MAVASYFDTVQKIYIAFYQRPADPAGLYYWSQLLDINGGDLTAVIDGFANSAEAIRLYDKNADGAVNLDDASAMLDDVFMALFNRAPDPAGKQFYLDALTAGKFPDGRVATVGRVVLDVLNGATSADAIAVSNKLEYATAFTKTLDPELDGIGPFQATYNGDDEAGARTLLAAVTADPTTRKTAAQVAGEVQSGIADAGDPILVTQSAGQTFTLTTGIDNITGTAGNDTIGASIVKNLDTGTSLNAGDNINGGAGIDTLLISATGDVNVSGGATISAFTLNGVEKVQASNFTSNTSGGGPLTVDLSTADSALTSVGLASSVTGSALSGNTTFSNVSKIVEAEMKNGGGNLSISYAAAAIAGATDAQTLTLSGATDTTGNEPTFDANGIETLNIASTGSANSVKVGTSSSGSLATVNATGDKALVLDLQGATNTAIKTIDASAATGAITLKNLADATSLTLSAKTGTADDTVYLAAGVTSNDTINAGTGTDTLVISGTTTLTTANLVNVTGFETVKIENTTSGASGNASFAVDSLAGITKVVVGGVGSGGAGAASVTLSNLAATTTVALNATNSDATGISATLKNNTAADTATVSIGAAKATDTTGVTVAKLDLGQFETINLTSTGGTSTAANQVTALAASSATSLVLTGDRNLAFGDASGSGGITATSLKSIDASAMTGKFTMNAAGSIGTNVTIKGGSAADVILGGSGNDSLVGGAGNDSITGNGGKDTIDAGDGADVITLGSGSANVLAGAGDDTIKITGGSGGNLTTNVTIAGGDGTDFLQFTDFSGSGSASISLTGGDSAKISNVTSVEVLGLDMSGVTSGSGVWSLAIDDATVAAAGGTLTFKATSTAASGGGTTTKLDAGAVVLSTSKVIADMSAINNKFAYVVGNGTENIKGSIQDDTVTVNTVAYLSANDTINAGNGTDTLTFAQTTGDASITAAQLANVSGFESITLGGNGSNKLTLTLTDAVLAANNSNSALSVTVDSSGSGSGGKVDATAVTSIYSLSLTGDTTADTLIGGAGNDLIIGGAGADTIDLSAGGSDKVRILDITANGKDVIKGFTVFGTGTTGATGFDVIQIAASSGASGSGGVVVSSGADLSSGSAIASGSATALEASKLVALTSTNAASGDAAIFVLQGIGVQNTGASGDAILSNVASGAKGLLMYYNTATQVVELASFSATDSAVTGNELTVLAQFEGITLTGLAGVTAANFELFGV